MTELISFIFGALIPSYLLWQKSRECQHLLNVILRREKSQTLAQPFEAAVKTESKDKGEYKDRRSRPTPIDILMKGAEEADTEQYLHDRGITTEH